MARRSICRGQLSNGNKCANVATMAYPLMRAGGRNGGGLCPDCYRRMFGYSTENATRRGGQNGMRDIRRKQTFSVELETAQSDAIARVELMDKGFIPSSDCTVDVEYKSGIYMTAKPLFKHIESIGLLQERGHLTINRTCGTHFHVGLEGTTGGINGMTFRMDILRRFNNSLLCGLSDYLMSLPDKGAEIFGRPIGMEWAREYRSDTSADAHAVFVNLEHEYSIEFRQCYFRNAQQYARCARLCRRWAQFMCEFADAVIAQESNGTREDRRTLAQRRRELAQQTGGKMIAEYQKAIAQGFNYDKGK